MLLVSDYQRGNHKTPRATIFTNRDPTAARTAMHIANRAMVRSCSQSCPRGRAYTNMSSHHKPTPQHLLFTGMREMDGVRVVNREHGTTSPSIRECTLPGGTGGKHVQLTEHESKTKCGIRCMQCASTTDRKTSCLVRPILMK